MLIDIHVHVGELEEHYPQWWADEIYRHWGGSANFRAGGADDLSPGERLLGLMDAQGIDKACVMTSDHRRVYREAQGPFVANDYLIDFVATAPDRLFGTCSVDPLRDPYAGVQEIRRMVTEHGIRAVKLYPSYDHFFPADEACWPIYRAAIELDIPIQFHMGWTPTVNAPMKYQPPHLLDEVGIRFPDLKVIVAHLGYPWVEEAVCLLAKHPNFHADLAYWGAFPPAKILRHLEDFRNFCSFEKLLYGSENSHTATFPGVVASLNTVAADKGYHPISDEEMELFTWRNAARLFKIPT